MVRCYQAASSPADGPAPATTSFLCIEGGEAGGLGVGGMSWAAILNSIVSFLGEPVGRARTMSNV